MAGFFGWALTPLKNDGVSSSMGLGWHPIYEMENNPFMFQTTNQMGFCHGNKIGNIRRGKIKGSGQTWPKIMCRCLPHFQILGVEATTWTREKSRDFLFRICKEPTKKVDSFHTSTTPCDIRATLAPASKGTTLLGPNRNPAGGRCGGRCGSQMGTS